MGKFDGMLICSDFDGTLFIGSQISDATVNAIKYFQENGGRFTITSGRYPAFLGTHRHRVDANTYLIGLNGTIVSNYDGTDVIRQGFLHDDSREIIKQIIRDIDGLAALDFSTTEIPDIIKKHCEAPDGEGYFRYRLKEQNEELLDIALSCKTYRVIFHAAEVASAKVTEAMQRIAGDRYAISRSSPCGLEIQDAEFTKGKSARFLADRLGIHTLICVGDYENDISMLREADIGCAVANAIPELKAVADRILPRVDQDPFVELIHSL